MPAKSPKISATNAKALHALGERIRVRRKALNLSATVAAEAAGMSRITWYRIEKGEPSVTMGAWASAAKVLGLNLGLSDNTSQSREASGAVVPVRINLADYPALRRLAWHVRDGAAELTAREVLDIFERNQRHLELGELSAEEVQLIDGLRELFGQAHSGN
ncbi:helix-turn-helix domain-containing protein [Marinihelvus fidelis]|nr:helix-turn-helix transcriptional regulator [Marinihelvus fidelis]